MFAFLQRESISSYPYQCMPDAVMVDVSSGQLGIHPPHRLIHFSLMAFQELKKAVPAIARPQTHDASWSSSGRRDDVLSRTLCHIYQ